MTSSRTWLLVLLVLALAAAGYDLGWRSLLGERSRLAASAADARATYFWAEQQIAVLQMSPVTAANPPDVQRIEQSLLRTGLDRAVQRLEPRDGTLRLTVEGAQFSRILRWLDLSEHQLGLRVASMQLRAGSDAGSVDGSLEMSGIRF